MYRHKLYHNKFTSLYVVFLDCILQNCTTGALPGRLGAFNGIRIGVCGCVINSLLPGLGKHFRGSTGVWTAYISRGGECFTEMEGAWASMTNGSSHIGGVWGHVPLEKMWTF